MNLGINGAELIILIVLAVLVLGPEKLPEYTRKLTELIRNLRRMAEGAKTQFQDETGTDFDSIDWKRYDPRQYDPRRIIRDALAEPVEPARGTTGQPAAGSEDPARPGWRGELDGARRERDALREDLQGLDPRALIFGSQSTAPARTPEPAEADEPGEPNAAEVPEEAGEDPAEVAQASDGEPETPGPPSRADAGHASDGDAVEAELTRAPFDAEAT